MRRRLAIAVAIAGCGRVHFTDRSLDGGSDDGSQPLDLGIAPEANLVAWYTFDDGSGTSVVDSSGNGLDGYTNACGSPFASWTTGHFGGAIDLKPDNANCVSVDENPLLQIAGAWTVSAWVNPTALPPQGDGYAIVIKTNAISQHNYSLFLDHGYIGAANLGWTVDFDDAGSTRYVSAVTYAITPGTWYQVAATWDGASLVIYANGSAAGTVNPATPPSATAFTGGGISLVGRDQCCGHFFDGAIDDVRIYNRALDSNEMATLFTMP